MGLRAVLRKRTEYFSIDVDLFCPEGKTLVLIGPRGRARQQSSACWRDWTDQMTEGSLSGVR